MRISVKETTVMSLECNRVNTVMLSVTRGQWRDYNDVIRHQRALVRLVGEVICYPEGNENTIVLVLVTRGQCRDYSDVISQRRPMERL